MDFDFKKIAKDAEAALTRVVQFTEEKLGTSEKTELDAHFDNLWKRAETTKKHTENLVSNTETVLIPNPGNRIEDFIYYKIEKKRPSRLSNLEYLGGEMIEAGNAFGSSTAYGCALVKIGQWEQKLGQTERDFIGSAAMCYTQPMKKFLETEMKAITKEKNLLEIKRLDLDACKNRVRRARSMLGQQTVNKLINEGFLLNTNTFARLLKKDNISPEVVLEQAERDLRIAQSEFDRQAEITKLLLEGIGSTHATHLRCLQEFVEAQARYYSQCSTIMTDLQRELANMSTGDARSASFDNASNSRNDTKLDMKKARVLYDYDAKDASELSLLADEVIEVSEIDGKVSEDYFYGQRGQQKGKVPKAFLEIID